MTIPIRDTTRQAWEALRRAGVVPSVRNVYAVVSGAYNTVAAECQALRAEGVLASPAGDPQEDAPTLRPVAEASVAGVYVEPALLAAFAAFRQALRDNAFLRKRLTLWARLMDKRPGMPLEKLIEALAAEI